MLNNKMVKTSTEIYCRYKKALGTDETEKEMTKYWKKAIRKNPDSAMNELIDIMYKVIALGADVEIK